MEPPIDPQTPRPGVAPRRGPRKISRPDDLAAAIKRVMNEKGLATREVVRRVPRRHVGTVYRLLAGRTTDPWASTIVSLSQQGLDVDVDDLLGVEPFEDTLDPASRNILTDLERCDEETRWTALDMLRAVLARRLHGLRGPKSSQTGSSEPTGEDEDDDD
jgi:hypothetical protein